ncbi:unnamed protein product [Adineta steineri]|uniref:Uncharacterized protein n=1 Tax=Adineta steineri TaxID=433720 RepID=A0A818IKT9_9BILA|nr:unnamed protein product [Adineta steineri]
MKIDGNMIQFIIYQDQEEVFVHGFNAKQQLEQIHFNVNKYCILKNNELGLQTLEELNELFRKIDCKRRHHIVMNMWTFGLPALF